LSVDVDDHDYDHDHVDDKATARIGSRTTPG